MSKRFHTSGQVASQAGMPRWRLLYLLERGDLPGPSAQVPGRRLFTDEDVQRILETLSKRPELMREGGDAGSRASEEK